jgi:Holliday junction resolvase
MGARQRQRGSETEREVCKIISEATGWQTNRILGQARDGGADVRLAQFLIEVKRRKSIAVYEWLEQCQKACKPEDKPVVIARGDHKGFVVIQPLEDWLAMAKRELPER